MSKVSIGLSLCAIVIATVALFRAPDRSAERQSPVVTPGPGHSASLQTRVSKNNPSVPINHDRLSEYAAKNDRLREELNALRADVQALQTQFEATQKALSKFSGLAGAADHNPDIPGLQTEDEIKGIPVLGDPTNTIDPNTPEDQLAEEQRTKEQASRLLAQSREAEERPGPSTEKGAVKESQ